MNIKIKNKNSSISCFLSLFDILCANFRKIGWEIKKSAKFGDGPLNRGLHVSLEMPVRINNFRPRVLQKSIFRYIVAAFMACLRIVMRTPYYSAAAFLMLLLLLLFRCPFTTIHKSITTKRSLPVTVVFYFYYGRATDLLFKW